MYIWALLLSLSLSHPLPFSISLPPLLVPASMHYAPETANQGRPPPQGHPFNPVSVSTAHFPPPSSLFPLSSLLPLPPPSPLLPPPPYLSVSPTLNISLSPSPPLPYLLLPLSFVSGKLIHACSSWRFSDSCIDTATTTSRVYPNSGFNVIQETARSKRKEVTIFFTGVTIKTHSLLHTN